MKYFINGRLKDDAFWDLGEDSEILKIANRNKIQLFAPNIIFSSDKKFHSRLKVFPFHLALRYGAGIFCFPNRRFYWALFFLRKRGSLIYFRGIPNSLLDRVVLRVLVWRKYEFLCYGEYLDRYNIVYNRVRPIDVTVNVPGGAEIKGDIIVYAGQINEQKGVLEACDFYTHSRVFKHYEFHVFGDGNLLNKLKKNYPNIIFHGRCTKETVQKYLKIARYSLFFSTYPEGFPRFLFECVYNGVIPVMYNFKGNSYYSEVNSIIVGRNDTAETIDSKICDSNLDRSVVSRGAEISLYNRFNTVLSDLY